MKFRDAAHREFHYVWQSPLAMAVERLQECRIFSEQLLSRPALDLGCGDGLFIQALFVEPLDCGLDIDPKEIERAREKGAYHHLMQCSAHQIDLPDASFRTILSNSVLEHIPDLLPVLREARRLLAADGRFLVTVPTDQFERYSVVCRLLEALNLAAAAQAYRRWYNRFWAHYHTYSQSQWLALFREAGFEAEEVVTYGSPFLCTLCDALVPFALPSLLARKALGRWIAVPSLRRHYVPLLLAFARLALRGSPPTDKGGLIFFRLKPVDLIDEIRNASHD